MPKVSQILELPHEEKYKGYHEVEKLIALAEELRDSAFRHDKNINQLVCASAALLGGSGVTATLMCAVLAPGWNTFSAVVGAVIILTLLFIVAILRRTWRNHQALRNEDERAMHKIVDMLREIEGAIAAEHNLTILERVELQTRLSRFSIGPSVQGAGTSFRIS